ncbi:MAG: metallophosphoesterase [Myxococcaceae bacterium]|nr:metallophosphoesterase [Myxococcaceae bacterium]MCI0672733.1 metallophosphoesterase [Myxococcaceae bacterium]
MSTPRSDAVRLVVGIGDIHGRFHRLQGWLEELEAARGRRVVQVFAVGDVEAFRDTEDHRRKAAKRGMPAEFAEYADGVRRMARPLAFIGGNNEDFESLHTMAEGGELAPDVLYLGRAGVRELAGLRVAYLSGILAPRFIDRPLGVPRSQETRKQAGYFRRDEVERVKAVKGADLMLVHEWPRGLVGQVAPGTAGMPSPWLGNPITRNVVEAVGPAWLLCGHSHRAFAATLPLPGGGETRVACLDQAARSAGSVFWLEYEQRRAVRAGWGTSGAVAWEEGARWDPSSVPELLAPDTAEPNPSPPGKGQG